MKSFNVQDAIINEWRLITTVGTRNTVLPILSGEASQMEL